MPIIELPSIATDEEIDEFLKRVGNNIKNIRVSNRVSQFELALTIGQKGSSLIANAENYTKGKRFNLEHLYKISKALDCDIRDFFV